MGVYSGPEINEDGLVLALDAANTKSYPGSGEIWYDLSGNEYNATRTNNSGYGGQVTHNSSGYWDFTVNTPTTGNSSTQGNGFTLSALPIPRSGSFTLSSFIRRDHTALSAGSRETIFGNAGGANGWRYGMYSSGLIYYLMSGETQPNQEGSIGSGYNLGDGVWHMVTSVYDRAAELGTYTIYGYVDGVEVVRDLLRVVAAVGPTEEMGRLLARVQLRDDRALASARRGEPERGADGALPHAAFASDDDETFVQEGRCHGAATIEAMALVDNRECTR